MCHHVQKNRHDECHDHQQAKDQHIRGGGAADGIHRSPIGRSIVWEKSQIDAQRLEGSFIFLDELGFVARGVRGQNYSRASYLNWFWVVEAKPGRRLEVGIKEMKRNLGCYYKSQRF